MQYQLIRNQPMPAVVYRRGADVSGPGDDPFGMSRAVQATPWPMWLLLGVLAIGVPVAVWWFRKGVAAEDMKRALQRAAKASTDRAKAKRLGVVLGGMANTRYFAWSDERRLEYAEDDARRLADEAGLRFSEDVWSEAAGEALAQMERKQLTTPYGLPGTRQF